MGIGIRKVEGPGSRDLSRLVSKDARNTELAFNGSKPTENGCKLCVKLKAWLRGMGLWHFGFAVYVACIPNFKELSNSDGSGWRSRQGRF